MTAKVAVGHLRSRRQYIERAIGERLLTRHEIRPQWCHIVDTIDTGLTLRALKHSSRFSWDIDGLAGCCLADLVLRTTRGEFFALIMEPDVALHLLRGLRFLCIDQMRCDQILDDDYRLIADCDPIDLAARCARRSLIESVTGLTLAPSSNIMRYPVRARYLRTVDCGEVTPTSIEPWTVVRSGRSLGDVLFRLESGDVVAVLVDPEEAEALRARRDTVVLLETHRSGYLI